MLITLFEKKSNPLIQLYLIIFLEYRDLLIIFAKFQLKLESFKSETRFKKHLSEIENFYWSNPYYIILL